MLGFAYRIIFMALALATLPARAQHEAMSFTLGRLEGAPACGAACAQFVVARGQITHGTAFNYFYIRKLSGDRNLPVILESPGGNVMTATFLAGKWREMGLTVIIAHAEATCRWGGNGRACDPKDLAGKVQTFRLAKGAECASACPMLYAGATTRLAMPDAKFGVHSPAIDPNSTFGKLASSMGETDNRHSERYRSELPDHFEQMGVSPALGRRYLETPNDKMDWLSVAEARQFGLVNAQPADLAGRPEVPPGLVEMLN